jgi:putative two-component system response regulator
MLHAIRDNQKSVLVVDDEPVNLHLIRHALKGHYRVLLAADAEEALIAATEQHPDIILLDIEMPEFNGFELCQHLKMNVDTRSIPIIFISAKDTEEDETKGFDLGAVDYIHKPISAPIMLRRIATHLSLVKIKELEVSQRMAIQMLSEAGHYHDSDTGIHIWRMATYARVLAQAVGWSAKDAKVLELAAPMHDTGKIGIPDAILKANRPLTPEEWMIMKRHTNIGYEILNKSDTAVFRLAAEVALCHHERWNGTGYPIGLSGNNIPESARIVAIVDVFDALTSKRPYKEPWDADKAFDEIKRGSGVHFDPSFARRFLEIKERILELMKDWKVIEKKQQENPSDSDQWSNNQETGS